MRDVDANRAVEEQNPIVDNNLNQNQEAQPVQEERNPVVDNNLNQNQEGQPVQEEQNPELNNNAVPGAEQANNGNPVNVQDEIERQRRELADELERLRREREQFARDREAFEQMRRHYMEQHPEAAENRRDAPEAAENRQNVPEGVQQNTPGAVNPGEPQNQANQQPSPAPAQEEFKDPNSKKGHYDDATYDTSVTTRQAEEAYKLTIIADTTALLKKSSSEYKKMQKAVDKFEKFMRGIKGKAVLSAEDMEAYDKYSLEAYKATDDYLKKKESQREQSNRKLGKNGEKAYKSSYEEGRVHNAEDVRQSIQQMRNEMFERQVQQKVDEMNARCQQQLVNLENSRSKMAADPNQPNLAAKVENNVSHSLYYANRMAHLAKKGELSMKPGESFSAAMDRLNASVIPKEGELDSIKDTPQGEGIIQGTLEQIKQGKEVKTADLAKMQKEAVNEMVPEVRNQRRLGQELRRANSLGNRRAAGPDMDLGEERPRRRVGSVGGIRGNEANLEQERPRRRAGSVGGIRGNEGNLEQNRPMRRAGSMGGIRGNGDNLEQERPRRRAGSVAGRQNDRPRPRANAIVGNQNRMQPQQPQVRERANSIAPGRNQEEPAVQARRRRNSVRNRANGRGLGM